MGIELAVMHPIDKFTAKLKLTSARGKQISATDAPGETMDSGRRDVLAAALL